MLAQMHHFGPWQIPTHVTHCLCPDGRRRYVRLTTIAPDTFFSHPGQVKYKGRTVSGFITGYETDTGEADIKFRPYLYGKNGHLFNEEA